MLLHLRAIVCFILEAHENALLVSHLRPTEFSIDIAKVYFFRMVSCFLKVLEISSKSFCRFADYYYLYFSCNFNQSLQLGLYVVFL